MGITFAIITSGLEDSRIEEIVASIEAMSIPEYEIIIAGGETSTILRARVRHIPFVENRGGWITGKKNESTRQAAYDNVVYLHDYFVFDPDWYSEFLKFGDDWDIQMNRVLSIHNERMLDWILYDHPTYPMQAFLPYDVSEMTMYQYISGGYWISKKHVVLDEPLDETRSSHHEEDLEWSLRVREKFRIRMNKGCVVRHNKVHRDVGYSEGRASHFGVRYKY